MRPGRRRLLSYLLVAGTAGALSIAVWEAWIRGLVVEVSAPANESTTTRWNEEPWFGSRLGQLPADEARVRRMALALAETMRGGPQSWNAIPPSEVEGHADASAREPAMVFISVSDGNAPARVQMGTGAGYAGALADALNSLRTRVAPNFEALWVKVDAVTEVGPRLAPDAIELERLEPSLVGILFHDHRAALLAEEVAIEEIIDDGELDQRAAREALQRRAPQGRQVGGDLSSITPFRAESAFVEGREVVPLYRGHRLYRHAFDRELLLDSAIAGGHYLRDAVDEQGRFAYRYEADRDRVSDSYNLLRHAGTVYSMLELYAVTGDEALLDAAERAIGYLLAQLEPCSAPNGSGEPTHLCAVESRFVKLGGNALAIIALAEHIEVTGDRTHLPSMVQLADWILAVQSDEGEFTVHKMDVERATAESFVSEYYPGEAILALLRLHALDGEERWLDAAASAARWLITVRDADLPTDDLPHDHWLLYGLNALHRVHPDPAALDHAMRIATAIADSQLQRAPYPDWLGSYEGREGRSTPTATRSEGLCAAHLLARDFGLAEQADRFAEGLRMGIEFQLQTQIRPENAMYLPNPRRALGGFRYGLNSYNVRIDYVQHNISSMLCAVRALTEPVD